MTSSTSKIRIAWLNVRKGLTKPLNVTQLLACMRRHAVDIILIQETGKESLVPSISLPGLKRLAFCSNLTVFSARGDDQFEVLYASEFFLAVQVDKFLIGNVHLSPYRSSDRLRQMQIIVDFINLRETEHFVVGGDFNFSPRPQDGIFGEEVSRWTKPTERALYSQVLQKLRAREYPKSKVGEYTIERVHSGKDLKFRCDFAFSSLPVDRVSSYYDHGTRLGTNAFTDHSLVLLEMEV